MQADGTITPLNSTQNFVLSEKQAGEILAQVHSVKTKNFFFFNPHASVTQRNLSNMNT